MGGTPTHPSPTTGWKEREGGRYSHTPFSHYRLEGEGGWEVLPHTLLPLPVGRRGRVGGTPTHPSPTTGWKEREGGRYSHTPFSHYRLEGEGGWEVLPHTLLPLPVGRRGRVGGTPTHPSPTTGWKEREGGRYSHTPFSHYRLEGEGGWEVLPHTLLPLPVGRRGRVGGTPTHPSPTTGWKEREGGRYSHTPFSHYRLEGEGGWEVLPHTLLPLPVGRRGRVGGTPTHPSPTTGWKEREGGRYSHTPFSHYRLEGEGGWEVLPHTLLPLPVGRRGRVGGTPTHPSPTTGWKEREGGRYSHTPFSHYR